jgi:hypothetical protein
LSRLTTGLKNTDPPYIVPQFDWSIMMNDGFWPKLAMRE